MSGSLLPTLWSQVTYRPGDGTLHLQQRSADVQNAGDTARTLHTRLKSSGSIRESSSTLMTGPSLIKERYELLAFGWNVRMSRTHRRCCEVCLPHDLPHSTARHQANSSVRARNRCRLRMSNVRSAKAHWFTDVLTY